jgi:hypothetical protein
MRAHRWLTSTVAAVAAVPLVLQVCGAPAEARPFRSPAAVLHWNTVAVRAGLTSGQTIQEGMMRLAYVQAAVFDAVVAVDGGYRQYLTRLVRQPHADGDVAVAAAAHRVLVSHFPAQRVALDGEYAAALAAAPAGRATAKGITLGEAAADAVLLARAGDGFQAARTYQFGSGPGAWVLPTDNPATVPATPWVAVMKPFAMRSADQFRPGPRPSLSSSAYAAAFQESKEYGSATSTVRSAEQTATALFWGLGRPDAQFNDALRTLATAKAFDRVQAARLLALTDVVMSDAFVACFDAKYTYSSWRPFTAIREAADDGNPATSADTGWTPLVRTPNHPEYPANHTCESSSFATTVSRLVGPGGLDVTVSGVPGSTATRRFTSAAALVAESGNARVWGGVHFRFATEAGARIGRSVAEFEVRRLMRPIDG